MNTTIIGYSYEADMHCQECAEKRFGMKLYGNTPVKDNEGNDVHPMFSYEDYGSYTCDDDPDCNQMCGLKHYLSPTCGDCFGELE